jgi:hypothetical protein
VIDRRVLPSGEIKEWERPATIPDDFIYDPEIDAYYPPGEATTFDWETWRREFDLEREERRRNPPKGPHLFTRDMLIAAGALNVKREKPKKSASEERGGLFDLFDAAESDADDEAESTEDDAE